MNHSLCSGSGHGFEVQGSRPVGENNGLKRKTHQTIKKVTEDMEGAFHFNTDLSAIMELVNEIYAVTEDEVQSTKYEVREAIETVVILLAPFVPHVAEEMWEKLGNKKSIFEADWPLYDKDALSQEQITLVVQINGRVRSKIEIPTAASEDDIKKAVLEDGNVNRWTEGKSPKKIIIVKGKLVNLVV